MMNRVVLFLSYSLLLTNYVLACFCDSAVQVAPEQPWVKLEIYNPRKVPYQIYVGKYKTDDLKLVEESSQNDKAFTITKFIGETTLGLIFSFDFVVIKSGKNPQIRYVNFVNKVIRLSISRNGSITSQNLELPGAFGFSSVVPILDSK